MISTDFGSNESWDDALISSLLLFQPRRWQAGQETGKVKQQIIKLFANGEVYLFLSGRTALYRLLRSLTLPYGSEVLVQGFTCEAVVLPILANNLKPIYVDIESASLSMSGKDLEKKLSKRARVLILQHSFGLIPKERDQILAMARKNNLIIIEDLAHGFDTEFFKNDDKKTIKLLSFGRSKAMSSVFGAALIVDNLIAKKLNNDFTSNSLSYPGFLYTLRLLLYKPLIMLIGSSYDFGLGKIIHKLVNILGLLAPEISQKEKRGEFDHLLDKAYPNALSILLLNQLKKFEQTTQRRRKISQLYHNSLRNVKDFTTLDKLGSMIRFPLLTSHRDNLVEKARGQNIFLGKWYDQVVAPRVLDLNKVGYITGSCPTAEEICNKIINLPTNITEKEALKVIKILKYENR